MRIEFEATDTRVKVTVTEVDRATVDRFKAQLAEGLGRYDDAKLAAGRCTTAVVVDLSDVEFLDSTGIRALLDTDREATRLGGRLLVTGANGIVRRMLELTGVLQHLEYPGSHQVAS
jgi:anti-sigma B factor antagonist